MAVSVRKAVVSGARDSSYQQLVPIGGFPAIRILEAKARPATMAVEIATPLQQREYNKAIDREYSP
jgi:hypothetical protein